jgi:hypothetical protein
MTDILTEIPYAAVNLRWHEPLCGHWVMRSRQLRGAIANAFLQESVFHQHDETGKELYRYPHIQYRWRDGYGEVLGWGHCAEMVLNLPWLDLPLTLNQDAVNVVDALITTRHAQFGMAQKLLRYRFGAPVLVFNQTNFKKYQQMNERAQVQERDRLLVAQILTALKGLGVVFPVILYAAFTEVDVQPCAYKKQTFLGISGEFVSNALLPDGFAIGHAVSHGYGWIEALD